MNTYPIGAGVVLDFEFRNAAGVLTNPSAATIEVERPAVGSTPASTITHPLTDLVHVSTGVYTLTVIPDVPGRWYYRGVATGSLVCASLDTGFLVEATRFSV